MAYDDEEELEFEWDKGNIYKNWIRHKVTNKETEEIFFDTGVIISKDPKHSIVETRYLILGRSKLKKYLSVIFTRRDSKIRIISARPMNRKERQLYEQKTKNNTKV